MNELGFRGTRRSSLSCATVSQVVIKVQGHASEDSVFDYLKTIPDKLWVNHSLPLGGPLYYITRS